MSCGGFYRVLNEYAEYLRPERDFRRRLRRHILKHYAGLSGF